MLEIEIKKTYKKPIGIKGIDINVTIPTNQIIGISGASGAGKTTLLRILAGLEKMDKGRIKMNDQVFIDTENNINLSTQERNLGFVFQEHNLFPNMTVFENLKYALKRDQSTEALAPLIDLLGIKELLDANILRLSGGEKQRVAIARALVRSPHLLLLDEPFSALDEPLKLRLQQKLVQINAELGSTILCISHDEKTILRTSQYRMTLNGGFANKIYKTIPAKRKNSNVQYIHAEVLQVLANTDQKNCILQIGDALYEYISTTPLTIGDFITVDLTHLTPLNQ